MASPAPEPGSSPTAPTLKVSVTDQQERLRLDYRWLKELARAVLAEEGVAAAQVNVVLLSDAAIQDVHRRFLNQDTPTDVITFPLSSPGAKKLQAEILISTDTAAAAATDHGGHAPEQEVALYLVHGLLHLCGYDDHEPDDRAAMRQREAAHLAQFGIRLDSDF
ncbi:MAG TPA: rRNA maturation RNase YbeY [Gemmatales bacterium]|nr:rRNA maturation RNase YbeY [Gemmatales bacterium]HMP58804.1 rRNA maturation RNase YbeY [Gemmatales bacterium]